MQVAKEIKNARLDRSIFLKSRVARDENSMLNFEFILKCFPLSCFSFTKFFSPFFDFLKKFWGRFFARLSQKLLIPFHRDKNHRSVYSNCVLHNITSINTAELTRNLNTEQTLNYFRVSFASVPHSLLSITEIKKFINKKL